MNMQGMGQPAHPPIVRMVYAGRMMNTQTPHPPPDPVDALAEVLAAAADVARAAPARPNAHRFSTLVPWSRVQRLRAAMDAAGITWRQP